MWFGKISLGLDANYLSRCDITTTTVTTTKPDGTVTEKVVYAKKDCGSNTCTSSGSYGQY